jgi:hypothetical protein
VFSSGLIVILSGLLMLAFALLCLALPVLNLYSLYGMKGKPDEVAVVLKQKLRLNWLPLLILVALCCRWSVRCSFNAWARLPVSVPATVSVPFLPRCPGA